MLTVATVCKNAPDLIASTIESVTTQDYENFEYVVIDGGSTDATINVLESYSDRINVLVSEPDSGIADAMNKAIERCSGDYIIFIHAGDRLLSPRTLAEVSQHIQSDAWQHDIYAFSILFGDDNATTRRRSRGFTPWLRFRHGIYHQGAATRTDAFKHFGPFDTRYKICSDYAWALNCYLAGGRALVIDETIAFMLSAGISTRRDWRGVRARFSEEEHIHRSMAKSRALRAAYRIWWLLYRPYRWVYAPKRSD